MILADVYQFYAQRDWAIAIVAIVGIICFTTILLFWWDKRK